MAMPRSATPYSHLVPVGIFSVSMFSFLSFGEIVLLPVQTRPRAPLSLAADRAFGQIDKHPGWWSCKQTSAPKRSAALDRVHRSARARLPILDRFHPRYF